MSKNILIVESDTTLSATLREALEARGFAAQETTDGKGSVERIRQERPDLVVLAVDLSAGQNGYLICGKLKKDEELKPIPIIIIGNPDGFAQHRKLKAHADEYLAHPVEARTVVEVAERLTRGGQVAPPAPGHAPRGVSLPEPGGAWSSEPEPGQPGGSWLRWGALALAGAVAAGWFFLR